MFIRHVLDVAGKDVNTQLLHVLGSLNHNLVREGITVRVNGPQCKRTDNLTHVALKGVLQVGGNVCRLFVQEVPHSQLHPFVVVSHPYLGNRIHHNIDEIVGWDVFIGLDIHCNLSKVQFIQLLKKRNFDACPSYEHPWLLAQAGNDVGVVRRRLDVPLGNDDDDQNDRDNKSQRGENKV